LVSFLYAVVRARVKVAMFIRLSALRLAQESVRAERRWSAPYYWAGFTLAGEWK
jgi:CHAT domain-containing protein